MVTHGYSAAIQTVYLAAVWPTVAYVPLLQPHILYGGGVSGREKLRAPAHESPIAQVLDAEFGPQMHCSPKNQKQLAMSLVEHLGNWLLK
eukprot:4990794-Prymnesium_polylepis.3